MTKFNGPQKMRPPKCFYSLRPCMFKPEQTTQ